MAVYLDCAATTPLDPRVREVVLRYMDEDFGNAGSRTHDYGLRARRAVEHARQQVAAIVSASRGDVIFTSGATESNNLAILGTAGLGLVEAEESGEPNSGSAGARGHHPDVSHDAARGGQQRGGQQHTGRRHIVTTAIEHHAVLEPVHELQRRGFDVTIVQPDAGGAVDAAAVIAALRPDTRLVSVMHVNNETGVIQPIAEIAALLELRDRDLVRARDRDDECEPTADEHGRGQGQGHERVHGHMRAHTAGSRVLFHVDAAQGFGKDLASLRHPRIDLISVSGHKIGAPKGVGALIARRRGTRRPPLAPLMFGGGQERGLRPGTLPVPLIAGLGLAAELAAAECDARAARCRAFREQLLAGLAPLGVIVNGDPARTVPNILNVTIPGIEAESAMEAWADLVAISNGAACSSQSYTCSHVLSAMRIDGRRADGALRFSWTHSSSMPDVAAMVAAIERLPAVERHPDPGRSIAGDRLDAEPLHTESPETASTDTESPRAGSWDATSLQAMPQQAEASR